VVVGRAEQQHLVRLRPHGGQRHADHLLAEAGHALQRELQEAARAHQGHELLGKAFPAQRPQARAEPPHRMTGVMELMSAS